MSNEARLHEILDIAEQAKREGDQKTFDEMMALYDQESAAPSAPEAPPAAPQQPQPRISNNPLEVVGGGLDALATMVSGAVSTPIAGLAGMVAAPFMGGDGAADVVEATQALLTHDPVSDTGKRMLDVASQPFQALAKGADSAGDKVLQATGSPMLAAGTRALIEGSPDILGLKGARAAGSAIKGARRLAPSGSEQRLLQESGVDLKRSQMGGERWKDVDRASTDVLGNSAMDVRQAQQFNSAVMDRAGMPGRVDVGPDVLRDLHDDISRDYDGLHSRRSTELDSQLEADLDQITTQAELDLAGDQLAQIQKKAKEIRDKAALHGGTIPGAAGQNIRTRIGKLTQSKDPFMPEFARALRDALDNAWERSARKAGAFDDVELMAETRARWRMADQLEKTMQGNSTGNVGPKKLYSVADKRTNRSAGLHDLARAGKNVLADSLANSGTAPRAANIGKFVGLMNRPGELARTLAGVGGGRFLNESPNIGVKAATAMRQPAVQAAAISGSGEALLEEQDRRTREFLAALGL